MFAGRSSAVHIIRRYASSNSSPSLSQRHQATAVPLKREAPASASIWNAFKTALGLQVKHTPVAGFQPARFNVVNNPYRAKKTWPPDFDRLSPRHRFHFEKTYRRRAKLKYTNPGWRRGVTIVQNTAIALTIIYFVFFLEVEGEEGRKGLTPFQGIRNYVFGSLESAFGEENKSKTKVSAVQTGEK